ncbi:MAG: flagellar motor protein MotB [Flavonifractor plautii]
MKKKKSGGGGANWMDTYGDMVTLLLCFFVMLYSMSTLDKEKWIALVQSFNPTEEVTETQPPPRPGVREPEPRRISTRTWRSSTRRCRTMSNRLEWPIR